MKEKIKIRKAKKSDAKSFIRLINELAEFEKLIPPDKEAIKRLKRDAFSKKSIINVMLAEYQNEIAGYAIYFFTYSSFLAKKSLYLEDIYISDKFRNKGIGKEFFKRLIKAAKKNDCGRMEWVVLDWNVNAIKFYEKLGAKHLDDWKTYRVTF